MTPPSLTQNTRLRLAPGIEIRVSSNRIILRGTRRTYEGNRDDLALLAAFAHPHTLEEGLRAVAPAHASKTPKTWIEQSARALSWIDDGILQMEDAPISAPHLDKRGYSVPGIHVKMLDDTRRTHAFIDAITRHVGPDDVVVDLGSGTGVLALAAAKAGARRVFAIEKSTMAKVARQLIAANGYADRVEVIEDVSTAVELPERGTLFVSEMIGNEALAEDVLHLTQDARARLLTPNARVIPQAFSIHAAAVVVPSDLLSQRLFTLANTQRWTETYGLDFSSLVDAHAESFSTDDGTLSTLFATTSPLKVAAWPQLSEDIRLLDIDLRSQKDTRISATALLDITADGLLGGIASWFVLDLDGTQALSTHPKDATSTDHWKTSLWLLPHPLAVQEGDRIEITYERTLIGTALSLKPVGAVTPHAPRP